MDRRLVAAAVVSTAAAFAAWDDRRQRDRVEDRVTALQRKQPWPTPVDYPAVCESTAPLSDCENRNCIVHAQAKADWERAAGIRSSHSGPTSGGTYATR